MEYVAKTLFGYLTERGKLAESETHELFCQMLSAIHYCHQRNVIHRDIKLQNILLSDDHQIKLIDFGLGNFMQEGKLRNTFCGTPAYAAPEIVCRWSLSHFFKQNGMRQ